MKYEAMVMIILCTLLMACGKVPTAKMRMLNAAESIVSQPENWRANSQAVVQFINTAADACLAKDSTVLQFEAKAKDLVTFGTKWTQAADKKQIEEFTRLAASIIQQEKTVAGGDSGAKYEFSKTLTGEAEKTKTTKQVVDLVSRYLDGSDSGEFQQKWSAALDAYKVLREKHRDDAL